jgi:hypothetical protein
MTLTLADAADEDEAKLRARLAAGLPAEAEKLGRPRFFVERPPLPNDAFKPAFIAFICCIPSMLCIVGSEAILGKLLGILFIGLFVGFAVWWIIRQLRKRSGYAIVYENGFVVSKWGGLSVWTWPDVAVVNLQNFEVRSYALFIEVRQVLLTYYRLRHRDGAEYAFTSVQGPRAAQFGKMVLSETTSRMLPRALARLQAGETIDFGPFKVDSTGLTFDGHRCPWPEVRTLSLRKGNVIIEGLGQDRAPAVVSLEAVDNGHIFLALVQRKAPHIVGE